VFLPSHKAGQVAAKFAAWRELTTGRVILSVLGVSIECTTTPIQHRLPAQTFSEHEYVLVCKEIHKLLQKGLIPKVGYRFFCFPRRMELIDSYFTLKSLMSQ